MSYICPHCLDEVHSFRYFVHMRLNHPEIDATLEEQNETDSYSA